MFKLMVLCGVLSCGCHLADCLNDKGPGLWHVQYIQKCEEATHTLSIDLQQNKINRTHDVWNGNFNFQEDIGHGLAINVEIFKLVDGGYRLLQAMSEPNLIVFAEKYCKKNLEEFFINAKIDPPQFPIKAGDYKLDNYFLDYEELGTEAMYGEYSGKGCIIKAGVDIFCAEVFVDFTEVEEDEEDDYEE